MNSRRVCAWNVVDMRTERNSASRNSVIPLRRSNPTRPSISRAALPHSARCRLSCHPHFEDPTREEAKHYNVQPQRRSENQAERSIGRAMHEVHARSHDAVDRYGVFGESGAADKDGVGPEDRC